MSAILKRIYLEATVYQLPDVCFHSGFRDAAEPEAPDSSLTNKAQASSHTYALYTITQTPTHDVLRTYSCMAGPCTTSALPHRPPPSINTHE